MDVPADIQEKANSVWADAVERSRAKGTVIDVSVLIAQALLSERLAQKERDAKIAYEAALYSGCPADFIAEEIAEAVRNQALGGTAYRTQGEDA
jgi:hypothetical protein